MAHGLRKKYPTAIVLHTLWGLSKSGKAIGRKSAITGSSWATKRSAVSAVLSAKCVLQVRSSM